MAEISKITLPSGTTYDLKDATARQMVAGGVMYRGVTTTALTDGASTNPITINGESYTAVNGDLVLSSNKEFLFSTSDNKWHEFGDITGLKALAYKDTASTTYKPAGTVSQPTFTGTAMSATGNFTPSGTIAVNASSGSGTAYTPEGTIAVNASSGTGTSYTPEGSVAAPTFTGTEGNVSVKGTPTGAISVGTGTTNYTPGGTVGTPTITVTPSTTTKYVASSATGGGSVSAGTAASCTLPSLSTSVENETLTLSWSAGSFSANTPTSVTLPSFASQTIATGISSATSTQPTWTGTAVELKFTGSETTSTGKFTPEGSNSAPAFTGTQKKLAFSGTQKKLAFTGTEGSVSVTGTPEGTVSQPTFDGTQTTITVS